MTNDERTRELRDNLQLTIYKLQDMTLEDQGHYVIDAFCAFLMINGTEEALKLCHYIWQGIEDAESAGNEKMQ